MNRRTLFETRRQLLIVKSSIVVTKLKITFNFLSYNLNDHEKSFFCKGYNFAIPPRANEYSEFSPPFEMVFRETSNLDIDNFNKECVKSRLRDGAYSSFK